MEKETGSTLKRRAALSDQVQNGRVVVGRIPKKEIAAAKYGDKALEQNFPVHSKRTSRKLTDNVERDKPRTALEQARDPSFVGPYFDKTDSNNEKLRIPLTPELERV